jgi:hypothetical protein
MAVVRLQLRSKPAEIKRPIDPAHKMILGNNFIKIELIEQALLMVGPT